MPSRHPGKFCSRGLLFTDFGATHPPRRHVVPCCPAIAGPRKFRPDKALTRKFSEFVGGNHPGSFSQCRIAFFASPTRAFVFGVTYTAIIAPTLMAVQTSGQLRMYPLHLCRRRDDCEARPPWYGPSRDLDIARAGMDRQFWQ
jgi:hypothetical protein